MAKQEELGEGDWGCTVWRIMRPKIPNNMLAICTLGCARYIDSDVFLKLGAQGNAAHDSENV